MSTIMLAVGEKSKSIIGMLKKQSDSLNIDTFDSCQSMINDVRIRKTIYSRIVFTSKYLGTDVGGSIRELNNFINVESPNSSVVFITNGKEESAVAEFESYFSSPMYCVAYIERPTPKSLLDTLKLPIEDIRKTYGGTGSGSLTDSSKPAPVDKSSEKPDSGKIKKSGSIFSRNKLNKGSDSISAERGIDAGNSSSEGGVDNSYEDTGSEESRKIDEYSVGGSYSTADNPADDDNSEFSDNEDLSLGSYGSSHSDSGLLDDDEADELARYMQSKAQSQVVNQEPVNDVEGAISEEPQPVIDDEDPSNEYPDQEEIPEPVHEVKPVAKAKKSKFALITGLSGSGVTQYCVDSAVKLTRGRGLRCLIVDLDVDSHGVLSFLDTKRFYSVNEEGLYEEDGVYILSTGYGGSVSDTVDLILSMDLSPFDFVIFDCPISKNSLMVVNLLLDEGVSFQNSMLRVQADISKIIETEGQLSRLSKEDAGEVCLMIRRDSDVAMSSPLSNSDIQYLNDNFVFAVDRWYSK